LNASAGLLALVLQLRFEHSPAGIEHGLGHPRLDEPEAAHVAYDDRLITVNEGPRKLMKRIGPTACRLAMNSLGLLLVPVALRPGQLIRVQARPSTRFERVPIAGRGDCLYAQVDSD
jgi:hypothetical protein